MAGLILLTAIIWALAELIIRFYFIFNDRSNPYIQKELRKNAAISEAYDLSLWEEPGIQYRKNASLELDLPDGDKLSVKINSKGFRTKEFSSEKPEGLFRIICVGGSTTVIGQSNRQTYPALLEEKLAAKLPAFNLEVLNLGISKYGTRDIINLAQRAVNYQPDLVIKYNGANDLWWDYFIMLKDNLPAWKKLFLKSYAFQWFFWRTLLPPDDTIKQNLRDGLFPSLSYLKKIIEKEGARLVIITFFRPELNGLTSAQKYYLDFNVRHFWGQQIGTFPFIRVEPYLKVLSLYNQTLRDFCRENDCPCIDLARRYPRNFDLYVDICHFSQEGIERGADLIGERLMEKKLIEK